MTVSVNGQMYSDFYTAYDNLNGYQTCYLDSDFNKLEKGLKVMSCIDGRLYKYYNESRKLIFADKNGDITTVSDAYNGDIVTYTLTINSAE